MIKSNVLITEDFADERAMAKGTETRKRVIEAADLGLKALNKIGRDGYDEDGGITGGDRWWFVFEDQTIGCFTVADLINQGYDKSFVKELINQADKADYEKAYEHGYFQLRNRSFGDDYLDALAEIKSQDRKVK